VTVTLVCTIISTTQILPYYHFYILELHSCQYGTMYIHSLDIMTIAFHFGTGGMRKHARRILRETVYHRAIVRSLFKLANTPDQSILYKGLGFAVQYNSRAHSERERWVIM